MGQINNDAPKVKTRVVLKHDTAINWSKATGFTPLKGEVIIYDIDAEADSTRGWYVDEQGRRINTVTINGTAYPMPAPAAITRIKIGNGIDNINVLPFVVDDFLIVRADFPADGNGNAQLTHFAPEIYEFVKLGRKVFLCENDNTLCTLVECSESVAVFQTALWDDSIIVRYFIYDDHIEKYEMSVASCDQIDQLQSNIDDLTLVVTWSGNELDAASCDLETIHQHAGAGRTVVFHKTTDRVYYPLAMCTDTFALFNGGITNDYTPQLTRFNIDASGRVTEYTTDLVCHYEFEDITKPKVLSYDPDTNTLGEEFETLYGMLESGNTVYISYDGEFLLHLEGYTDDFIAFGGVLDETQHYQRLKVTRDNSIYTSDYYIADNNLVANAIDNINLTLANRGFTTQQKQNVLENLGITEQINAIPLSHAWDGTILYVTSNSGTTSVDLEGPQGIQGFGIVTAVERQAFTEAKWAEYGIIGDTESWTDSSTVRNGCRVGDIFMVYGTATDSGNAHVLYFKNTTASGDLGGPCIAHSVTMRGSKGDRGVTFTPNVDSSGELSWTNDGGLTNPTTVNIKGPQGDAGAVYTPSVSSSGTLSWTNNGGLSNPASVNVKGADGIGIESITQTSTSSIDSGTNTITITKTDGTSASFNVFNGSKGSKGDTPVKGTDYFTDSEIQAIENNVAQKAIENVSIENMLNFYDPTLIDIKYCNPKNIPGWQVRFKDNDVYDKSNEFFSGGDGMKEHKEVTFKAGGAVIDIGIQTASTAHNNSCKISNLSLVRTDGQSLGHLDASTTTFGENETVVVHNDTFNNGANGWSGTKGAGSGYGRVDGNGLLLEATGWNGAGNKIFTVTPGVFHTVSFYYKANRNGLNVKICDGTSSSSTKLGGGYLSKTTWTLASYTFIPTGNNILVNFSGSNLGTTDAPDSMFVDDFTVSKATGFTLWDKIIKNTSSDGQFSVTMNATAKSIRMKSSWSYWNDYIKIPLTGLNLTDTYILRFKADVTSNGVNLSGENISWITRDIYYISSDGYYIASFQPASAGICYITFKGDGQSKDDVTISDIHIFNQNEPIGTLGLDNKRWIAAGLSEWQDNTLSLNGNGKTYSYGLRTLAVGVVPDAEYRLSFDIEYEKPNTYNWMPYITFTDEDKIALVTDDCIPSELLQCGGPWIGTTDSGHVLKTDIDISMPNGSRNPSMLQFIYAGDTSLPIKADITLYDPRGTVLKTLSYDMTDYVTNWLRDTVCNIPLDTESAIDKISIIFTPNTQTESAGAATIKKIKLFSNKIDATGVMSTEQRLYQGMPNKEVIFYNKLTAPAFNGAIDDGFIG